MQSTVYMKTRFEMLKIQFEVITQKKCLITQKQTHTHTHTHTHGWAGVRMAWRKPQDTPHYLVSSERNGGSRGPVGGGPHTRARRHPLTPTPASHLIPYHSKASLVSSTYLKHPHFLHHSLMLISISSTPLKKQPKLPPPPAVDITHCTWPKGTPPHVPPTETTTFLPPIVY